MACNIFDKYRDDEVRSRTESIEHDRKERHKDWHRRKNEELRRDLMKVYGPSREFLDQGMKLTLSSPNIKNKTMKYTVIRANVLIN